ncbi:uncharacterized protein LOC119723899 [Patiria miniata]|uniref:Uncharacterized protein n=1 Tax=Patiria miniata TaxID=46514 RepID=A0A913ZI47_PATMI|nr:uncharacterized protein LOC119723899 [Patiria miniata]
MAEPDDGSTANLAVDTSIFAVGPGEFKDAGSDDENQPSTSSAASSSTQERPKSASSDGTSSKKSSKKATKRPWSGLRRSNAVEDASLVAGAASNVDGASPAGTSTPDVPGPSESPAFADKWADPTLSSQSWGSLQDDADYAHQSEASQEAAKWDEPSQKDVEVPEEEEMLDLPKSPFSCNEDDVGQKKRPSLQSGMSSTHVSYTDLLREIDDSVV